jgi:hypothetical protein
MTKGMVCNDMKTNDSLEKDGTEQASEKTKAE